jgi:hypothetical protein
MGFGRRDGAVVAVAGAAFASALLLAHSGGGDKRFGVANPDVTQANIAATVCKRGWTATIRPPVSYTTPLKRQQLADGRYPDQNTRDYEEDHIISLELGGHPTDKGNLFPEPYPFARASDHQENLLRREVCDGRITLEEGQKRIVQWKKDEQKSYPQNVRPANP